MRTQKRAKRTTVDTTSPKMQTNRAGPSRNWPSWSRGMCEKSRLDMVSDESTIDPSLTMSNLDFSHIPLDQLGQFLDGPALFVCIFGLVVSTVVLLARFCVRIFYLRKGHVVDGKLRNPFGALLLT